MRILPLAIASVFLGVWACSSTVDTNATSHGGSTTAGHGGAGTTTKPTSGTSGANPGPNSCSSSVFCASDEYCQFPSGACDPNQAGLGVCTKKPTDCPVFELPSYACGCDGKLYESACEAAQAGFGISNAGGCPAPAGRFWCGGSETCAIDTQICWHDAPDCPMPDNGGCFSCWPVPDACTASGPPTCECVSANSMIPCAAYGECDAAPDGSITVTCNPDI